MISKETQEAVYRKIISHKFSKKYDYQVLNEINKFIFNEINNIEKSGKIENKIKNIVAHYFDLEVDKLSKNTRKREILRPRQICMYLIRNHSKYSLTKIGSFFKMPKHCIVIHSIKTIENEMTNDKELKKDIEYLQNQLK